MAQVNSSDVFPHIRKITTGANGDLEETLSEPALKASATLNTEISVEAKNTGAEGNLISVEIVDFFGGGANSIDVNGNAIQVRLKDTIAGAVGGTPSTLNYNGSFDISTIANGPSDLEFTVVDNVTTSSNLDEVKVDNTDGDIRVCLVNDISQYNNGEIRDLLTLTTTSWYASISALITVGALAGNGLGSAITFTGDLDNGTADTGQTATLQDIVDLLNTTSLVDASVSAGNENSLPSVEGPVSLEDGQSPIASDLDSHAEYILFKVGDIHSMEGGVSTEFNDARKVTWGILEQYAQYVLGQSVESQPENFLLARGNPTLVIDAAGTRIRQVYTIQAFYATGDFDLEDETAV